MRPIPEEDPGEMVVMSRSDLEQTMRQAMSQVMQASPAAAAPSSSDDEQPGEFEAALNAMVAENPSFARPLSASAAQQVEVIQSDSEDDTWGQWGQSPKRQRSPPAAAAMSGPPPPPARAAPVHWQPQHFSGLQADHLIAIYIYI
jgi:hypothetical protein